MAARMNRRDFSKALASKEEIKRIENERSRAVVTPDGWKLVLSDVCKGYEDDETGKQAAGIQGFEATGNSAGRDHH